MDTALYHDKYYIVKISTALGVQRTLSGVEGVVHHFERSREMDCDGYHSSTYVACIISAIITDLKISILRPFDSAQGKAPLRTPDLLYRDYRSSRVKLRKKIKL